VGKNRASRMVGQSSFSQYQLCEIRVIG